MVNYLFIAQIIFIIIIQQIHDGRFSTFSCEIFETKKSFFNHCLVWGAFGYTMDLNLNSPIVANNVLQIKGTLYKSHKIADKGEGRRIHLFLEDYEVKVSTIIC